MDSEHEKMLMGVAVAIALVLIASYGYYYMQVASKVVAPAVAPGYIAWVQTSVKSLWA